MPTDPPLCEKIAVLMPMTSPLRFKRAHRVARLIDASVWMKFLVRGDAHVGPAGRADDAHGDGLVQPEGVADGDRPLPERSAFPSTEVSRPSARVG